MYVSISDMAHLHADLGFHAYRAADWKQVRGGGGCAPHDRQL